MWLVLTAISIALPATSWMGCGRPDAASQEDSALAVAIDDYLAPLVEDHQFSGVVLVGTPESVVATRAYGMADVEAGSANRSETGFRIASLTKTMTAGAIAILADRGLLALSDSLSTYLPDVASAERISIRHLLRHESGLANPDYLDGFSTTVTLNQLIARITAKPLLFEPGTDGRYSNAGFNMLAYVIQDVSGMPYDSFLSREIFSPLGMTSTRMVRDLEADSHHATGYIPAPGPTWFMKPPNDDIGFSIGSGSLSSTVHDLYRWGLAIHGNQLFDLDAQIESDWPYGWGKIEVGPHRGVEQTGAVQGFMSSLAVFDDGTIVVLLMNVEHGKWVRVARDLAAIVFDEQYDVPTARQIGDLNREQVGDHVGYYEQDDRLIEIRALDGHLWLYSDGWPVGKYLVPLRDGTFDVPSDNGHIRFAGREPDGFTELTWDFGSAQMTFVRRGR